MITCPLCGKSHYEQGYTMSTAMYFPPIYKDGVNINPDRNKHTTTCKCLECHHYFYIIECGDEIEVKPGEEYQDVPTSNIYINANNDNLVIPASAINLSSTKAINSESIDILHQLQEIKKDIEEIKRAL